jgi:fatty-acyl-CoA synthase
MLTHGQVHWNALNTILACDLRPPCSTLTFTPLFHTGGMNCLTTPMLHRGGKVVLTPGLDAGQALRLIAEERITHLMGVPTIYRMLADHADFAQADLSSVADALCGGAPLPAPLLEQWLDRGVPLRQGFGLTEVGPNCFSTPPAEVRRKLGCVGLPIHHIAMKLVRPDGSECGTDEPGELVLGGPVVFGGYWNHPEETRKVLESGWFHTGDVLSRDGEGYYSVRGRLKEMYISGGENVYPAEVEATLNSAPGVALSAVVGVPDARWGEVGVAFLEPLPGAALSEDQLRSWVDGRLARYKIPRRFLVEAELPRTASGKVDKAALRQRALR